MIDLCTIHQRLDSNGLPLAQGSEVRLPSGDAIPHITSVVTRAEAGTGWWETTITLRTLFGEPIPSRGDG